MTSEARHLHFRAMPNLEPPAAWSLLDHAVARWVVAHKGPPALAMLAGWASFAEGQYRLAIKVTDKVSGKVLNRDVNFTVKAS